MQKKKSFILCWQKLNQINNGLKLKAKSKPPLMSKRQNGPKPPKQQSSKPVELSRHNVLDKKTNQKERNMTEKNKKLTIQIIVGILVLLASWFVIRVIGRILVYFPGPGRTGSSCHLGCNQHW